MPASLAQVRRSVFRLLVGSSLVGLTSGCSLVAVNGPPTGHEAMTSFECTESRVLPILDVNRAGSGFWGVATAEEDKPWLEGGPLFGLNRTQNQILSLIAGATSATSAVVGFRRVSACRAAKEELARRSNDLALDRSPED